jgi:hypothetical protein
MTDIALMKRQIEAQLADYERAVPMQAVHGRTGATAPIRPQSAWSASARPPHVVAAARRGEVVPRLKSSPAPRFVGWVTITLRESASDPERNSNIADWLRFADWLRMRGESVVIVRDTARAAEPLPSFGTCPQASTDLHTRMALYAAAKCNLFVSNGPYTLALFMDAPWLTFFEPDPEGAGTMNTPSFWAEHFVPVGEQFPWCRPDQRLTWKADRYENLVAEWDRAQ